MSKQSKAKAEQNYREQDATCENCARYTFDIVREAWGYNKIKNKRCSLGGFAVSTAYTCDRFESKARGAA